MDSLTYEVAAALEYSAADVQAMASWSNTVKANRVTVARVLASDAAIDVTERVRHPDLLNVLGRA